MPKCLTQEEFIKRSKDIWGDRFDYSKVNYIDCRTKVEIRCKEHDKTFFQEPCEHYVHLRCPLCKKEHHLTMNNNYVKKMVEDTVNSLIGKRFVNSKGYAFTIIGGVDKSNLTIQYDNGYIKEHVYYQAIKKGLVHHPKPHLGETSISLCGQVMTIIEQNGSKDITVQFNDGTIVEHRSYGDFKRNKIANPNFRSIRGVSFPEIAILYYLSQCGFSRAEKNTIPDVGNFELDMYNSNVNGNKVAIEYDGVLWHQKPKRDIEKNKICSINNIKLYRIREPGLPTLDNNATEYILTSHHNNDINKLYNIAVQLIKLINRDCGTNYSIKKSENDKENIYELLSSYYYAHREKRLGETRTMNGGLKATIIAYRSSKDIDIEFETGDIVTNCRYDHFKNNSIKTPYSSKKGETSIASNGQKMTIIAARNCQDIDVMFEDGVIVKNIRYGNFRKGHVHKQSKPDYMDIA